MGNTGNAIRTRPHLHFGIYAREEGPVDPWYFVYQPRGTIPRLTADTSRLGAWLRTPRAGATLFARAGTDTLRALPAHTPLRVLAAAGEWFRVRLPDGSMGYVVARRLEALEKPVAIAVGDGGTSLLAIPVGQDPEVVMKELEPSARLEVFGYFDGFVLIRTGGLTGWIPDRLTD